MVALTLAAGLGRGEHGEGAQRAQPGHGIRHTLRKGTGIKVMDNKTWYQKIFPSTKRRLFCQNTNCIPT